MGWICEPIQQAIKEGGAWAVEQRILRASREAALNSTGTLEALIRPEVTARVDGFAVFPDRAQRRVAISTFISVVGPELIRRGVLVEDARDHGNGRVPGNYRVSPEWYDRHAGQADRAAA